MIDHGIGLVRPAFFSYLMYEQKKKRAFSYAPSKTNNGQKNNLTRLIKLFIFIAPMSLLLGFVLKNNQ